MPSDLVNDNNSNTGHFQQMGDFVQLQDLAGTPDFNKKLFQIAIGVLAGAAAEFVSAMMSDTKDEDDENTFEILDCADEDNDTNQDNDFVGLNQYFDLRSKKRKGILYVTKHALQEKH